MTIVTIVLARLCAQHLCYRKCVTQIHDIKDYQGQGVASAICDELERAAGEEKIITNASITAKPFFEKRGYKAVKEQQVIRKGIPLTNCVMEK